MKTKHIPKVIIPVVEQKKAEVAAKRITEMKLPWCAKPFMKLLRGFANVKSITYTADSMFPYYEVSYKLRNSANPKKDSDADQPSSVEPTLQPHGFFLMLNTLQRRMANKSRDGVLYVGYALGFNAQTKCWVLVINTEVGGGAARGKPVDDATTKWIDAPGVDF